MRRNWPNLRGFCDFWQVGLGDRCNRLCWRMPGATLAGKRLSRTHAGADPGRLSGGPGCRRWMVQGDLPFSGVLDRSMQGIYAAYYLIHNMTGGRNYYEKEIESAVILLRGRRQRRGANHLPGRPGRPEKDIGLHLRSRIQTGNTLRGSVPVTEFRASLIIARKISFEMIRYLTEQFPLVFGPPWMHNRTQPIAIQNVLDYLVAALENPVSHGKIYEIGGWISSPTPGRFRLCRACVDCDAGSSLCRGCFKFPGPGGREGHSGAGQDRRATAGRHAQ